MWRERFSLCLTSLWARPLIPAAVAMSVGVAWGLSLGEFGTISPWIIAASSLGLALAGWAASRLGGGAHSGLLARVALLLLAAALGLSLGCRALKEPDDPDHVLAFTGRALTLEARVDRAPERGSKTTHLSLEAHACTQGAQRSRCRGNVMVYVNDAARPWRAGDLVAVTLTLRRTIPNGGPGGFDYGTYMQRRGYWVRGFVRRAASVRTLASPERVSALLEIERLRGRLGAMIDAALPPEQAIMAKALTIGMRKDLPQEIREVFLASGTAHLLAISGLHLGVMAFWVHGLVWVFWRRASLGLRVMTPDRVAALVTLPFVWAAALLAGLQVSTLRAALMISVYLLARLLWRRPDSLTSLSLAAMLILSLWPYALGEVGFQLSFVSVLSIVLGVPRLTGLLSPEFRERMERPAWRWRAGRYAFFLSATSLVTFLATAPILAADFHVLSWSGLFTNLVIPPLYGLIIPIFGLSVWLGLIHPVAAYPFLKVGAFFTDLSIRWQGWLYEAIGGFAYWQRPPGWIIWGFYLMLLATVWFLPTDRGWRGEPNSELLSPPAGRRRAALIGFALCALLSFVSLTSCGERSLEAGEAWVPTTRSGTLLISVDRARRVHALWGGPMDDSREPVERQALPETLWGLGRRRAEVLWLDGSRNMERARGHFADVAGPASLWRDLARGEGCTRQGSLRVCPDDEADAEVWRLPATPPGGDVPVWVQAREGWLLVAVPRPHRISAEGWRSFARALKPLKERRRVVVVQMGPGRVESFGAMCKALAPDAVVLAMNRTLRRYLSRTDWESMRAHPVPVFRTDLDGSVHIDAHGAVTVKGRQ